MADAKNLPLISIITAIYNAESHLSETLDSIINQKYRNIEVLLINDGSTDNSESICTDFVKKDRRFILVNQKNCGVANARNTGLKNSSGDYIIHVDSDDLLLPDALTNLYLGITDNNADISIGNYIVRHAGNDVSYNQLACISAHDFLDGMLAGKYHAGLWNKIINKKLYEGIEFDNGLNYMEDKLLLTKILIKNPKITFIANNVYIYRQVETSYSNNISVESLASSYIVTKKICKLLKDNSEYYKICNHLKLRHKILVLLNSNQKVGNIFSESNKNIIGDNFLTFRFKILLSLEALNISFFSQLYKKLK